MGLGEVGGHAPIGAQMAIATVLESILKLTEIHHFFDGLSYGSELDRGEAG